MNRLSFPSPQPCCRAAIFLFLATLPSTAFSQKAPIAPSTMTLAAPATTTAPATPLAVTQKQMLAQDSRLDRLISLDVISVPLNEVLQKESMDKSTETMEDGHRFLLTAAPDCADLKMQIRLNNRPLRTLMTALAQMVPGTWTRTPHGYQLAMTKEAVNARAEWWRLFLGEREKALALQRKAVLAAMQTKAYRRKASDPDPEQSDLTVEEDVANQHDFFYTLPPALKEQIAANMDDSGFYEVEHMSYGNDGEQTGIIGWLSQMPPQTQEKFKAAMQNSVNRLAQAPPAYQKYAIQAQRDVSGFDTSKVYFLFQNGGFVVYATPFNCPPSVKSALDLNLHIPISTNAPPLILDQAPLAAAVQKMGKAAPDEWKRLAAYQYGRVWPNTLPSLSPQVYNGVMQPVVSRAAQTDWLGEKGHMEYVCDYYSHGGYEMPAEQKKLPVKRPLAKELDEMAAKRDVSWTQDADGIYLVRDNRWYRDDNLEVPEPLLRRWFAPVLQARRQEDTQAMPQSPEERLATLKQTWDWAAEVFSTLTPWQVRNGLAMFQPEEKDLAPQSDAYTARRLETLRHRIPQDNPPARDDILVEATRLPPFWKAINMLKGFPHTAQFYGSLDDTGRAALLEGRLPASALSASQLAQAVSLQPMLPQAMQNFPPDSVLLGLLNHSPESWHVVFGEVPRMRLEVSTPPQGNAPRPPTTGE